MAGLSEDHSNMLLVPYHRIMQSVFEARRYDKGIKVCSGGIDGTGVIDDTYDIDGTGGMDVTDTARWH